VAEVGTVVRCYGNVGLYMDALHYHRLWSERHCNALSHIEALTIATDVDVFVIVFFDAFVALHVSACHTTYKRTVTPRLCFYYEAGVLIIVLTRLTCPRRYHIRRVNVRCLETWQPMDSQIINGNPLGARE